MNFVNIHVGAYRIRPECANLSTRMISERAIRPYSSLGEMWNSFFHIRNLKVNVKIKRKGGVSHYEIENASLILVSNVNSELFCLGCYYFAA